MSEATFVRKIPQNDPLHTAYNTILTQDAIHFLEELVTTFEDKVEELHWNRLKTKSSYKLNKITPQYLDTLVRWDKTWRVAPLPPRLQNRRVDLGDVSPANTRHFLDALQADVQGIQVDFDDGHCPTWKNQITGLFNVYKAVHGEFSEIGNPTKFPILMLRPRAWNMIEHNILIKGKKAPGALVDFGLLMFHNAKILERYSAGPYFYLSKLEGSNEAKLWNDIFLWTQNRLQIAKGTIKACVLIENILASFEMEEILFELKDHSLGLNCGIWDYSASIIAKFGDDRDFILPDRNKYVNTQRHFLKKYFQLVIKTCHARGALATGGMAAQLVLNNDTDQAVIDKVVESKRLEISYGVDGFMVYDVKLVPYVNKLWVDLHGRDELKRVRVDLKNESIIESDLIKMPTGGVTFAGLLHNVEVSILFIYSWLNGKGHFFYKGAVEDSATAEISRSQIWQWIRHEKTIEDGKKIKVTPQLIEKLTSEFLSNHGLNRKLITAAELFLDIVFASEFPDFITTYLNNNYAFRQIDQNSSLRLNHKL